MKKGTSEQEEVQPRKRGAAGGGYTVAEPVTEQGEEDSDEPDQR